MAASLGAFKCEQARLLMTDINKVLRCRMFVEPMVVLEVGVELWMFSTLLEVEEA